MVPCTCARLISMTNPGEDAGQTPSSDSGGGGRSRHPAATRRRRSRAVAGAAEPTRGAAAGRAAAAMPAPGVHPAARIRRAQLRGARQASGYPPRTFRHPTTRRRRSIRRPAVRNPATAAALPRSVRLRRAVVPAAAAIRDTASRLPRRLPATAAADRLSGTRLLGLRASRRQKTNPMAIASIVASLIGVLCWHRLDRRHRARHRAPLNQIKQTREGGHGTGDRGHRHRRGIADRSRDLTIIAFVVDALSS